MTDTAETAALPRRVIRVDALRALWLLAQGRVRLDVNRASYARFCARAALRGTYR